ncbi:hypothetical protein C0160_01510 [Moraxella catarrhalis]|nr:hypothetical protein [Moraxella catarrhalis]MPW72185.1 hypothetical protein [Moraxella catarrhalis]MPW97687.1 hypothetical protein [Moraxella catarrhalis]MPX04337.1 hypothetical protein [Moraxella catarrhalis]MPX64793.1 hypothetical protein [Moraxella catarrhalis]
MLNFNFIVHVLIFFLNFLFELAVNSLLALYHSHHNLAIIGQNFPTITVQPSFYTQKFVIIHDLIRITTNIHA